MKVGLWFVNWIILLCLPNVFFSTNLMQDSFKEQQLKITRVKTAYAEKEKLVKTLFSSKGMDLSSADIYFRAFKKEAQMEVWAKASKENKYVLIKTFSVCASSGVLGPKRKQGDGQVPEGFYEIDRFNPASNFHLSLGLNYPNKSDKILGKANLGGDIFIHGNCVTIGCLPLTDDLIKEVYIMAVEARSRGQQRIPVHVFPCKLNKLEFRYLEDKYKGNSVLVDFWKNLEAGYQIFEKNRVLPSISVDSKGAYLFK